MRIAVTGSIATDHLMSFPGHFTEQIVAEQLSTVSLSFLVDALEIRRGGIAANVAFGMGCLGQHPTLVGSVGSDFADYRSWLERHGVDTESVHVSTERHTARFLCTTDADQNQIASFYAGAMSEARDIELAPVAQRLGGLDLVLIGANDPDAMLRHTAECIERGYPFAADPSQQLARMEPDQIGKLVAGAAYLFTNEYESALIERKTGWSGEQMLDRVGVRVTTLGPKGVRIERSGEPAIQVGAVQENVKADPTGIGDAFRAGFLCAIGWGLSLERAAQLGNLLATYALEAVGTQDYEIATDTLVARLADAYGREAADEVVPYVHCPRF